MKNAMTVLTAAAALTLGLSASADTYNWTGGGDGASFSPPANWGVDAVDFSGGHDFALNGLSGGRLTCDTPMSVNGLTFGTTAGDMTVVAANGGAFTVGAGGLTCTAESPYWDVCVPVCVRDDQEWTVSGRLLYVEDVPGSMTDYDPEHPATITKKGAGTLMLGHKESPFKGTLDVAEGTLALRYTNPISADATVRIGSSAGDDANLQFWALPEQGHPGYMAAKIDIDLSGSVRAQAGTAAIRFYEGATGYELAGPVTYRGGNGIQTLIAGRNNNATLTFSGGITGTGAVRLAFEPGEGTGPGLIRIVNKPWVSDSSVMSQGNNPVGGEYPTVEFAVAGNSFTSLGHRNVGTPWWGSHIKTTVDYAFDSDDMAIYLDDYAQWDLCGTSQRVGNLETVSAIGHGVVNTSDKPATIYNNQTEDWTHKGFFSGKINLVKTGSGVHTIDEYCNVEGDLDIRAGGFVLGANGCWAAPNVVRIGPSASISLSQNGALGETAHLSIADGGKLVLADGIVQTVVSCKANGKMLAPGSYTAEETCDTTACSALQGGGILNVLSDDYIDIVDDTLLVEAGDVVELSKNTSCGTFSKIVVRQGGTLNVMDEHWFPVGSDISFTIEEGATLNLPAGMEYIAGELTINGKKVTAGGFPFGEGKLFAKVTYTWTGGGEARISDPANWGGELPNFSAHGDFVFPAMPTGSKILWDEDVHANSLFFDGFSGPKGNFEFTALGTENGRLVLYDGGLRYGTDDTTYDERYIQLTIPTYLKGTQTWQSTGCLRLYDSDIPGGFHCLDEDAPATIVKTGPEYLILGHRDSAFSGTVELRDGPLALQFANPLSANAHINVTGAGRMILYLATVPCGIDIRMGNSANHTLAPIQTWIGQAQSEISGHVKYYGTDDSYLFTTSVGGGSLTFSGGLEGNCGVRIGDASNAGGSFGSIVIKDKPWVTTSYIMAANRANDNGTYPDVVFAVPDNYIGSIGQNHGGQPWWGLNIVTTVDWAFDNEDMPLYIDDHALWDLKGTVQRVGNVELVSALGSGVVNTSDKPATIYNNQTENWTHKGTFSGCLSIVKTGTGVHTIATDCDVLGNLDVRAGGFVFAAGGFWRHAAKVTIAEGASVTVAQSEALGDNLRLIVHAGGAFVLSDGATQTALVCKVGDVVLKAGRYSKDGRDGTTACSAIEGDGILTVTCDSFIEVADGVLLVPNGQELTLDESTIVDDFTNVVLGAGATLNVMNNGKFAFGEDYAFVLADDAVLSLAEGVEIAARSVKVGDAYLPAGRHAFGQGTIYVDYQPVAQKTVSIWNARGNDLLATNPDNWSVPEANLTDGSTLAVFASDGTKAALSSALYLNGISATRDFYLMGENSATAVRVGQGGITAATDADLTVEHAIMPVVDQTWTCDGFVDIHGGLMSDSLAKAVTLTLTGEHGLRASRGGMDGTFTGDIVVDTTLEVDGGQPLGCGGLLRLTENGFLAVYDDTVIERPVVSDAHPNVTFINAYGRCEFRSKVTFNGGLSMVMSHPQATMVLSGGVEAPDGDVGTVLRRYSSPSAVIVITNTPIACAGCFRNMGGDQGPYNGDYGRVEFAVPGNKVRTIGGNNTTTYWHSGDLWTTVDEAFDIDPMMGFYIGDWATFDLRGTKQHVVNFQLVNTGDGTPTLTNSLEKAATLYVQHSADWTQGGVIGGNLNFVLTDTSLATMTITNAVSAVGSLEVLGGAIAFEGEGSWRHATNVVAKGSGCVRISRPKTLWHGTTLRVDSLSNVSVAKGVTQRIRRLFVNGVEQVGGEYACGEGTLMVSPRFLITIK